MLVTSRVWNAVIYLSMVELKSAMCDSDQGNRGIGDWEWSGTERNRAEWSRIRIIRIKIKESCDIIAEVKIILYSIRKMGRSHIVPYSSI